MTRTFPHRVGGNIALDLANTISWRGSAREVDHLPDTPAILDWAPLVGLEVPDEPPRDLTDDIRRLRAEIFAAGSAAARGRGTEMPVIRDLAARSLGTATTVGIPVRLLFTDPILSPLAWAALDLFRGDEVKRLKKCPGEHCGWLFLDHTRNGTRRWCEMATCGNRAKKQRLAASI